MRHRLSAAPPPGAVPRFARQGLLLSLLVVVPQGLLACGEMTEPSEPSQGGSGTAASGGMAGAGMSLGGTAGSSAGTGGTRNVVADAGPDGGGTSPAPAFSYPAGCPVPAPTAAPEALIPQKVAIQSINFITRQIVIKNISTSPVIITGNPERSGWQWCNFPAYWYITETDVTLLPGQTYKFFPDYNQDGVREFYPDQGEIGIYSTSGSFDEADLMLAFVSWGARLTGGRENVATLAKIWTFDEHVALTETAAGFVATGPADRASSYVEVPARCLVAPPNPPVVQ